MSENTQTDVSTEANPQAGGAMNVKSEINLTPWLVGWAVAAAAVGPFIFSEDTRRAVYNAFGGNYDLMLKEVSADTAEPASTVKIYGHDVEIIDPKDKGAVASALLAATDERAEALIALRSIIAEDVNSDGYRATTGAAFNDVAAASAKALYAISVATNTPAVEPYSSKGKDILNGKFEKCEFDAETGVLKWTSNSNEVLDLTKCFSDLGGTTEDIVRGVHYTFDASAGADGYRAAVNKADETLIPHQPSQYEDFERGVVSDRGGLQAPTPNA